MGKEYRVFWTDLALEELTKTIKYLRREFSQKGIDALGIEIERVISIISRNPKIFPLSNQLKTRKVVVLKFNTLYYRIKKNNLEIISFFSNRQSPRKRRE